jgi:outer membrane protease
MLRNFLMRRFVLALLCAVCWTHTLSAIPGSSFLFGEDSVSLDFGVTLLRGQIKESVYINDYLLSRLDWEVPAMPGITVGVAYKIDPLWILCSRFMAALPGRSGMIRDYDWAESDDSGGYLLNGVLSHYSESENYVRNAFRLDADFLYLLTGSEHRRLDFVLGLTWQHFSFQGKNGFYQYPPESDPVHLEGLAISYMTDHILPVTGLAYSRDFGKGFSSSSILKAGIFGIERAYDQHHLRQLDFYDYFLLLPQLEFSQTFSLDLSSRVGSAVSFFVLWYPETRGWSYVENLSSGESGWLSSIGSASSVVVGAEMRIQFLFGGATRTP